MRTLTVRDINILVTAAIERGVSISCQTNTGRWINGPITNATAAHYGHMILKAFHRIAHSDDAPWISAELSKTRASYRFVPTPAPTTTVAGVIAIINAAAFDAPHFDETIPALFIDRLTLAIAAPA